MKLTAKQSEELHAAFKRCQKKWNYIGVARVMEDGTKEVGTFILPEIHEQISPNYSIAHGFKVIARGATWEEVFALAGI